MLFFQIDGGLFLMQVNKNFKEDDTFQSYSSTPTANFENKSKMGFPTIRGWKIPPLFINPFSWRSKFVRATILVSTAAILLLKVYILLFYLDPILGAYSLIASGVVISRFYVAYLGYKDPHHIIKKNKSKKIKEKWKTCINFNELDEPFVSVIIPVKNDPDVIGNTIKSVVNSTYKKLELIVINDGSTDNTAQVLEDTKRKYPKTLRVIHLERNMGKRHAMRRGIDSVNPFTEVIVVVDSDSIIKSDAIEKLIEILGEEDVGAVCGIARAMNAKQNFLTKMQDTWYDGSWSINKAFEGAYDSVTCCPGVLSAYRKEAIMPCLDDWENDQFLGQQFPYGDDRHLTSFVMGGNKHKYGNKYKQWKVKFTNTAIAFTEVPSNWRKFINQQIRWKKSWVRVFLFCAPFFYKNRHPVASIMYYLTMIWSLLTPFIAARALVFLPLQGEWLSTVIYISGISFISLLYCMEFCIRNPKTGSQWFARLVFGFVSLFMSVLLYYGMLTINNRSWLTR